MKHQQYQTFSQNPQFESQIQKDVNYIYCKEQRYSTLACINKKCLQYAFTCEQTICSCRSLHSNCLLVKNQTLFASLSSKTISSSPLQDLILDFIDSFIDKLSQFKDSIEKKLKDINISCLGEIHQKFLLKMKKSEVQGVTGKEIWEVCFQNGKEEAIQKKFTKNCKYIEEYLKDFQQQRVLVSQKILKQLKFFESTQENHIFHNSDIVRCSQQAKTLEQFFAPKKSLSKASLLYRATQHNFSVQKFHELCHHISNTLVLCWTDGDKKIGGYTPLPWLGMLGRYSSDESLESFIFSLTHKDKLPLRQKNSAIYYYNDTSFAFSFGSGGDLKIANHADKNNNSRTKINTSYVNNEYEDDDPEAYEKFCGNSSSYFRVKEWEVWRVEFQVKEE